MSKERMTYHLAILAVTLFCASSTSSAATVRSMTLDGLTQESDLVIYGRVLGSRSVWDPATQTIWTQTEFAVLDGAKGKPARTLLVTEPGGVIGDVGHLFPGVPRFSPNQELVLFLYRAPGNRLRVSGLMQGVYNVERDRKSGERVARPAAPQREEVYEEDRAARRAGASATPRGLGEFLLSIRRRVAR